MTDEYALKAQTDTDATNIANIIGTLMLIEIGIITNVQRGRATVQLMRLSAGTIVELEDVELLYPGNSRGGAFTHVIGSICMLLCPRTLVENTRNHKVRAYIKTIHSMAGIKAIPLSNMYDNNVSLDYNDSGGLSISTSKAAISIGPEGDISLHYADYGLSVDKEGIAIGTTQGPTSLTHRSDGSIIESQWNGVRPTYLRIRQVDGTETVYRNGLEDATDEQIDDITSYEKWQWVEEYNADGTHTTTLYDADGNVIYSIAKQPDGTEDTNSVSPYTVIVTDSDGKEQVSIKATNDGKLDIKTEDTVTLTAKGDVTVQTEGAVNIEATKQGLLTLKNSVDSLGKIIEAIIDNINTFSQNVQSIDTVGSPASHSAGPGIIANMSTLQSQLAQLKQKAGKVLG